MDDTTVSAAAEDRLREICTCYPDARSAVMPALYLAQEEFGLISDQAVEWVAERLNVRQHMSAE